MHWLYIITMWLFVTMIFNMFGLSLGWAMLAALGCYLLVTWTALWLTVY